MTKLGNSQAVQTHPMLRGLVPGRPGLGPAVIETTVDLQSEQDAPPIEPTLPKWPFFVVMAYLMADFGRPQDWFPALSVLRPGILTLGAGILALLVRHEEVRLSKRAGLMMAFIALMIVGVPLATNRYYAFMQTKDFVLFFIGAVVPLTAFVSSYQRVRRMIAFFVCVHIPLSLYCLTHVGVGVGAFLMDENDFALALCIALPYAYFSLFFAKSVMARMFLVFTVGLLLLSAAATMSRGGFLGILAVGFVCWLSSPRRLASLALMATLSIPLAAMIPGKFWTEMQTIETADQEGDTGEQRLYLWSLAWQMFLDHPVVGVGPTNFQWNSDQYESKRKEAQGLHIWGKAAHSVYFTLLPELGLVGVAVFFSIAFVNFRENRKIRKDYQSRLESGNTNAERLEQLRVISILTRANDAAMCGYFVAGAFLSVLYYPHFWLQTAFALILTRVYWSIAPAAAASSSLPGKTRSALGMTAAMSTR